MSWKKINLQNSAEKIRDSLETLIGEERLNVKAIEGLEDMLKEFKKEIPLGRKGGGGFSAIAYLMHRVDDETPTGTVNGSNKDFDLAHAPSPTSSLKCYVNGQRMRITEDYTFSARTISFLTAPPTGSILICDYHI